MLGLTLAGNNISEIDLVYVSWDVKVVVGCEQFLEVICFVLMIFFVHLLFQACNVVQVETWQILMSLTASAIESDIFYHYIIFNYSWQFSILCYDKISCH